MDVDGTPTRVIVGLYWHDKCFDKCVSEAVVALERYAEEYAEESNASVN